MPGASDPGARPRRAASQDRLGKASAVGYRERVRPLQSARDRPLWRSIPRLAAALAPLALTMACSAGAPAPGSAARPEHARLPRLSWHPRKGTTEIPSCHEPSYDCDKVGLEKCEQECADGELPDCVALAEWQHRNVANGGNPARGLSLLRIACDKGSRLGCVALAADPAATGRDRATVLAALAPPCAADEGLW